MVSKQGEAKFAVPIDSALAGSIAKLGSGMRKILQEDIRTALEGRVAVLLKAKPDKWAELVKTAKTVKDYIGIDPNGEPNVFMFDIPYAGGGTEASVFYGVANFNAVWDLAD